MSSCVLGLQAKKQATDSPAAPEYITDSVNIMIIEAIDDGIPSLLNRALFR